MNRPLNANQIRPMFRLPSLQHALLLWACCCLSTALIQAQCSAGSTLLVGPADQYAFQWCNGSTVTQIGLHFASSVNEYQFKKPDGSNLMTLNPTGGTYVRMGNPDAGDFLQVDGGGRLSFAGTGAYLVANNTFAFQAKADQDIGLFFNATDGRYAFQDAAGASALHIQAMDNGTDKAGDVVCAGSASIQDEVSANGTSTVPAVSGFGANGPTNGYLGVQGTADFAGLTGFSPAGQEIGVLGVSVGSTMADNIGVYGYGNGVGMKAEHIGGHTAELASATHAGSFDGPVAIQGDLELNGALQGATLDQPELLGQVNITGSNVNTTNQSGLLKLGNSSFALGLDNNGIQSYASDSASSTLYLNHFGGHVSLLGSASNTHGILDVGSGLLYADKFTGRVGVGNTSPNARLHVSGAFGDNALRVQVSGSTKLLVHSNGGTALGVNPSSFSPPASGLYVQGDLLVGNAARGGVPGYKAAIDGKLICEELTVELNAAWPDYVFAEGYVLPDLLELEQTIAALGHLPDMPSAEAVAQNGVQVGAIQRQLLQKVEELTLYTIEQQKRISALTDRLEALQAAR